jgi:Flp pilus assembly protein TadG
MTMPRRAIDPCRRRGAVAVEMAMILGVCLAFLLGLFDFGRIVFTQHLVQNAAREGARLAIAGTDRLTTQDIENCVINHLAGQTLRNMNVAVYKADPATAANIGAWTDAGLGECIAVEITGEYVPAVPTFSRLSKSLPMTAKSLMYSEAN